MMNLKEQRERCAEFRGWIRIEDTYCNKEPIKGLGNKHLEVCEVSIYRPDENIQHAQELLEKLVNDGYCLAWTMSLIGYVVEIYANLEDFTEEENCLSDGLSLKSWGSALTEAVAEMQKEGE